MFKPASILAALLGLAIPAFCQSPTIPPSAAPNSHSVPDTDDLYQDVTKDGFSFPVSYIGEVQANLRGGYRSGAVYNGLLEAGVVIDLSKLAKWPGLTFAADAYYPHGDSLSDRDVHDLNSVSSIQAAAYPRLYELWLEQDLMDGKLSIRFGQLPVDTEFFLTTCGALFFNGAFGAAEVLALNMNAPVYPVAAPGVRVWVKPDDHWGVLAGAFIGNPGDVNSVDRYGTNFNFNSDNGVLLLAELNYTSYPHCAPPPGPDGKAVAAPTARPLSGTYKVGGFYDSIHFYDIKTGKQLDGDYGLYAVADQELWHKPGNPDAGLRGFSRIGWAPSDRNLVDFEYEGGLNLLGPPPGRDKDLAGLAFAYTKTSTGVLSDAGTPPARHYESIIELTYQASINDHLSVQPDVQYVINPSGGAEHLHNALVVGMRFNLSF